MTIPMHPATSTNVAQVGYDRSARTLRVLFRSGGLYEYDGCDAALFEQMLLPNPWRRLGPQVKALPCRRVA